MVSTELLLSYFDNLVDETYTVKSVQFVSALVELSANSDGFHQSIWIVVMQIVVMHFPCLNRIIAQVRLEPSPQLNPTYAEFTVLFCKAGDWLRLEDSKMESVRNNGALAPHGSRTTCNSPDWCRHYFRIFAALVLQKGWRLCIVIAQNIFLGELLENWNCHIYSFDSSSLILTFKLPIPLI